MLYGHLVHATADMGCCIGQCTEWSFNFFLKLNTYVCVCVGQRVLVFGLSWEIGSYIYQNLVLGSFLSCKQWSYCVYFGPTLGLIFAARNGPRTIPGCRNQF